MTLTATARPSRSSVDLYTAPIAPRPITITVAGKTKTYGDADPNLTWGITGGSLVGSDQFTGGLTRAAGENVGSYPISSTLALSTNYALTVVPGSLSITPRRITVTADNKTKVFGTAYPALTYQVAGLVNNDQLTGSLTRTAGEAVASYDILQGSVTGGNNYNIDYTKGTLTITAWTLGGFFQPVDMGGTLNTVKAGSTVPLKFTVLAGATPKTTLDAVKSFTVSGVACPATAGQDEVEITTTGGTTLRYDATAGQFVQNYQTSKTIGCYRATMTTQDGSTIIAFFMTR